MLDTSNAGSAPQLLNALHYKSHAWEQFVFAAAGNPNKCTVSHQKALYEVWQESNESDFLLTMNFILFTNQGYPLQNGSLGQLHSDGGIVSIVRSSAVRLLLE